ncbi:MAG: T9SS type A sorting domain-containing protein [Bacteroidia bacterium]
MKTYLTTLALLFITTACLLSVAKAQAQSVFNTNDSHVWYSYYDDQTLKTQTFVHYFTLATNADTFINSTNYKKMYYEVYTVSGQNNYNKDTTHLAYCTRYDSAQQNVYAVFKDSVSEHLFYKFNIHVGDTLHNLTRISKYSPTGFYTSTFVVADTASSQCLKSNRILLRNTVTNSIYDLLSWWQGVGSECMLRNEITPGPVSRTGLRLSCTTDSLQQCPQTIDCKNIGAYLLNKQAIQQHTDIIISPNPSKELIKISSPYNINTIDLINTNGISLNTNNLLQQISPSSYMLNVTTLYQGIYFLNIICDEKNYLKKIIVN